MATTQLHFLWFLATFCISTTANPKEESEFLYEDGLRSYAIVHVKGSPFVCAGSYVHKYYVITSVQCLLKDRKKKILYPMSAVRVIMGLRGQSFQREYRRVTQFYFEQTSFDKNNGIFYLALLKLSLFFTIGHLNRVAPVTQMPPPGFPKLRVEATGFGVRKPPVTFDDMKRSVLHVETKLLDNGMIFYQVENANACVSELGGPIVYNNFLVGITVYVKGDSKTCRRGYRVPIDNLCRDWLTYNLFNNTGKFTLKNVSRNVSILLALWIILIKVI